MAQQVTNRVASQGLRGQAVKVTLNLSDSAFLEDFSIGDVVEIDSNNVTGTIYSIDTAGNSFLVNPIAPNLTFSSTGGYLAASQTVTVSNT